MITVHINGWPFVYSDSGGSGSLGALIGAPDLLSAIRYSCEVSGGVVRGPSLQVRIADLGHHFARTLSPSAPVRQVLSGVIQAAPTSRAYVTLDSVSGLSVGSILFAPLDAWEVEQINPSGYPANTVKVRRGVYTALPVASGPEYQPHYQIRAGAYATCEVAEVPVSLVGRVLTVWLDGALVYIGRVEGIQQHGTEWTISARWILDGWRERFAPEALPEFRLASDPPWQVQAVVSPDGQYSEAISGGCDWPYLTDPAAKWRIHDTYGWTWFGSGQPAAPVDTPATRATRAALGGELVEVSGRWHTSSRPLGPRGWIDGPALEVALETPMTAAMAGQYVVVPDGIEGELVKQVSWVSTDGLKAKLSGTWTRDGEPVNGYAGASGERIAWRASAIVSAPSVWDLVVRLLVSTGAGVNGAHDVLPGHLGLGIPAQYVDTVRPAALWESEISGDLAGTDLEAEPAAHGYRISFDGRFLCDRAAIPEAVAASAVFGPGDLVDGAGVVAEHHHAAPVAAVELGWRGGRTTVAVSHASPWETRETRKLDSATRVRPPDAALVALHALLARWASFAGVRVSLRVLPGRAPACGGIVRVTAEVVATGGGYGGELVGVVVESGIDGTLTVEAALKPAERFLCPALEIEAVNHTTKRLTVTGGALEFARWPADTSYDAVETWGAESPVSVGAVAVVDESTIAVASTTGVTAGMALVPRAWSSVGSTLKANGTWVANTNWRRQ